MLTVYDGNVDSNECDGLSRPGTDGTQCLDVLIYRLQSTDREYYLRARVKDWIRHGSHCLYNCFVESKRL